MKEKFNNEDTPKKRQAADMEYNPKTGEYVFPDSTVSQELVKKYPELEFLFKKDKLISVFIQEVKREIKFSYEFNLTLKNLYERISALEYMGVPNKLLVDSIEDLVIGFFKKRLNNAKYKKEPLDDFLNHFMQGIALAENSKFDMDNLLRNINKDMARYFAEYVEDIAIDKKIIVLLPKIKKIYTKLIKSGLAEERALDYWASMIVVSIQPPKTVLDLLRENTEKNENDDDDEEDDDE